MHGKSSAPSRPAYKVWLLTLCMSTAHSGDPAIKSCQLAKYTPTFFHVTHNITQKFRSELRISSSDFVETVEKYQSRRSGVRI